MIDLEALLRPLSADASCGPDLEAEGDLDYMNFMARIEGDLPASFFAFDRTAIDFKADESALIGLIERSRDLRPLVALAKLAVLNRDLGAFGEWLTVVHGLLTRYWADVHPAAADGQLALRSAVLQSLDDLPTVILPLQYAPLFNSRRIGTVTFRTQMVVDGEVPRRDGEPEIDAGAVAQALAAAEPDDLGRLYEGLVRLSASVEGIRKTWISEGGFNDAPTLERLAKLTGRMVSFIGTEIAQRNPQADAGLPEPSSVDVSATAEGEKRSEPVKSREGQRVASSELAAAALAAVADYLAHAEPSSPALLLVCQAQRLVGRGFAEIVQIVMPDAYDDARITVGGDRQLVFRLDRLPEVNLPSGPDGDDGTPLEKPAFNVLSRRDVQVLLDEIAAFYRDAEPSNPIPLICERARALCSLDFLTLMRDMVRRD